MRSILTVLFSIAASTQMSCARVHRLLPTGPVLADERLQQFTDHPPPSGVDYTSPPLVEFPVLPVQIWGLHYNLDLVLVSNHPDWTMHEYARVDTPDGPLWLAKDADNDGVQRVVADLPEIDTWLPEIPVPRKMGDLQVDDSSTTTRARLEIRYENTDGEAVEVHFTGRIPRKAPNLRNGSTMEHSRQAVAAVLDLAGQTHGGKARISIGGQAWRVQRLLGLYRMQFVLDQVQGGFAVASMVQTPAQDGFTLRRPIPGDSWPTASNESWVDDGTTVSRTGQLVSLIYTFPPLDGVRELAGAGVRQVGEDEPIFTLQLDRRLPDLRRRFDAVATSRFIMNIHGQRAHGTGLMRAWWEADGPVVEVLPESPWWLANRPMRSRIIFETDPETNETSVLVRTVRIDPD